MKVALFILIGIVIGYVAKDLLTKESEITYIIKKLRARKGGEITVDADATVIKPNKKEKRKQRRESRKKKK